MSLSVVTCVSNPISDEYYLSELINSVYAIADEIIIVNGDNDDNELWQVIDKRYLDKIKIYHNPWEDRMGKKMYHLQKSIGISHATCDYVLRLDADEVLMEEDHHKVLKAIKLGYPVYYFRVLHFWGDYKHIKSGKNDTDKDNDWYNDRVYLFRNNMQIADSHDKYGNYTDNLVLENYEPADTIAKRTSIRVFHYGHARSKNVYLKKKNKIERAFHPDWEDLADWEFDFSGTVVYDGEHPKAMMERINARK